MRDCITRSFPHLAAVVIVGGVRGALELLAHEQPRLHLCAALASAAELPLDPVPSITTSTSTYKREGPHDQSALPIPCRCSYRGL
jgi:hypothetical protein